MGPSLDDPVVEMTISDFELPDWEVLYFVRSSSDSPREASFLLLHRKYSTGELYAIGKIIPHNYSNEDWMMRRRHDATALAQIPPHPNIIKLYSAYEDVPRRGKDIVILEYCAGGDLDSLAGYASSNQRRLPEVFVWHVLCQILITMKHLDRFQKSHSNLFGTGFASAHLLLRPVEGDAYPDIVLAEFEYCQSQNEERKRSDFDMLGTYMLYTIIRDDTTPFSQEVTDDTIPYSQELRSFVRVLFGGLDGRPPPLPAETERDLIPLAKKRAYGDDKITAKMPEWMITYFNELKSSRESFKVLLDSDAESSVQGSAAPGSRKILTHHWGFHF